jgi:hypothetical protein
MLTASERVVALYVAVSFSLAEKANLGPVPGHYRNMLGLPC